MAPAEQEEAPAAAAARAKASPNLGWHRSMETVSRLEERKLPPIIGAVRHLMLGSDDAQGQVWLSMSTNQFEVE